MPHEMNELIKSFKCHQVVFTRCTPPEKKKKKKKKKHSRLWNKIYYFWSSVCLFLTIVKGNLYLFETCVQLQLQSGI